jgi:hypothetical protein
MSIGTSELPKELVLAIINAYERSVMEETDRMTAMALEEIDWARRSTSESKFFEWLCAQRDYTNKLKRAWEKLVAPFHNEIDIIVSAQEKVWDNDHTVKFGEDELPAKLYRQQVVRRDFTATKTVSEQIDVPLWRETRPGDFRRAQERGLVKMQGRLLVKDNRVVPTGGAVPIQVVQ